jgi:hypothetical protein
MKGYLHISAHKYGYHVVIERLGITYAAFVRYRAVSAQGRKNLPPPTAKEKAAALAKAVQLRDEFAAEEKQMKRSSQNIDRIIQRCDKEWGRIEKRISILKGRLS